MAPDSVSESSDKGLEAFAYCMLRILTCKRFACSLDASRYSVISRAVCDGGMHIAIKTYDRPSLVPKKQKMATREAIVLKYLNSQGWVEQRLQHPLLGRAPWLQPANSLAAESILLCTDH